MATTNALGFIKKDSDVETLTVSQRPISLVIVGDTGSMTGFAVGQHSLKVPGTTTDLILPRGYTVYRADIRVVTAPTSANSTATVALGTTLSGKDACFNTAEVVTAFPLVDSLVIGNVATSHTTSTTDAEAVAVKVGVEALTAGRLIVYLNLYASV
jgi:hypothetical protein